MPRPKIVSQMKIKIGPVDIELKNMHRWVYLLVAIGILMLLVCIGSYIAHRGLAHKAENRLKHLLERGEEITTEDFEELEKMGKTERDKLVKDLEGKLRIEDEEGFTVEQTVAPGTSVLITRGDGGEVEIRKGEVPPE